MGGGVVPSSRAVDVTAARRPATSIARNLGAGAETDMGTSLVVSSHLSACGASGNHFWAETLNGNKKAGRNPAFS
jgi:hypothetical protein